MTLAHLVAAAFAAACMGGASAADPVRHEPGAPQVLAAPHYGDTLFHFYQDRTFAAITGLMVSQHFGRIAPHDDEAELLRGGMLLAYGLYDEAEALFTRLIDDQAAPAVRDRAWYFLAKGRHQRGLQARAEAALGRIAAPLPGTLEDDRRLLQAQLLMARGDHAGAAVVLDGLQASKTAAPAAGLYARFNLGVALVRIGDVERGHAMLDAVGSTPAPNEELRSLRDRANVALGLARLAAHQPQPARDALQRVRLQGPQSNKALLGFGWAAAELREPGKALVPWTELAGRGGIGEGDAAVLESRIAVPYALAELGATRAALQGYEDAATGFEREQAALAESIAAIRDGRLVQGLVAQNPSDGSRGLAASAGIGTLPAMPHAAHLAPLLAGNDFQESFKHLRDLQFLDRNLQDWLASLDSFHDMLATRQRAFAERLPAARAGSGTEALAALQARRDALAAELDRVQADADAAAFASAGERALLERIARGRATLAEAGDTPELADAAERLRRAAGALTWQLAQDFSARAWDTKKALRAADGGLAQARDRDAALARAQQDEPVRHAAFARRIAQLAQRLNGLRPEVAVATRAVEQQLQDIAVAELEAQQQRLAVYAAQARLAIAQLHDRAQFARQGNGTETTR